MKKTNITAEPQEPSGADDPRYLSSVERGFRVLDALSSATGAQSLTELARQTGLAIPTLQRLTATLVKEGYVARKLGTKRYQPTVKTVDLLYSYLSRNQFAKRAWPYLVKLRESLGLDVSLSVPLSGTMIYVHRLPGFRGNFENTLPGKRIPMHLSASGRCVMSLMTMDEVEEYFDHTELPKLTPWSQTDRSDLAKEIFQCRDIGYSLVTQESSAGMATLACPITQGAVVTAGVSVHTPIAGFERERFVSTVLPSVVSVSQTLSTS